MKNSTQPKIKVIVTTKGKPNIHEIATVSKKFRRKDVWYYQCRTERGTLHDAIPDSPFHPIYVNNELTDKLC